MNVTTKAIAAQAVDNAGADIRSVKMKRLAGMANAVASLLAVIDILPPSDQESALDTCVSIANDVASDLAGMIGGAA